MVLLSVAGLILGSGTARAQATIEMPTLSSGGGEQEGTYGTVFATVGEPFAADTLKAISDEATWTGFWLVMPADATSSVREESIAGSTAATSVTGVSPNPFSSEVTIEIGLARAGNVSLAMYDLLGREVDRLLEGWREPGRYRIAWRPENLAPGAYMLRLRSGNVDQWSRVLYQK